MGRVEEWKSGRWKGLSSILSESHQLYSWRGERGLLEMKRGMAQTK